MGFVFHLPTPSEENADDAINPHQGPPRQTKQQPGEGQKNPGAVDIAHLPRLTDLETDLTACGASQGFATQPRRHLGLSGWWLTELLLASKWSFLGGREGAAGGRGPEVARRV